MALQLRFRSTLIISYLVIIIIPLSLVFLMLDHRLEEHALGDIKTSLIAQAGVVSRHLTGVTAVPLSGEVALLGERAHCRITVISLDGNVRADSERSGEEAARMENHRNRPEVRSAIAGTTGIDTRHSATLNIDMLYIAVPMHTGGAITGVVRLAMPLTSVARVLQTTRQAIAIAFFIAVACACVLGSWFALRISTPVNDMIRISRKFAQGDLSRRIAVRTSGEIAELAATLNTMAQEIEDKIALVGAQNQKLAAILNSMVEGIIAVDRAGRIVSVNPTIEKMFGVRASFVEGKGFLEVIRTSEIADIITRALHQGEYISSEIELVVPVRAIIRITATPLADRGTVNGCLLMIYDVTELRRLETIRRDFVANVSHELKTPLTSIKGFVETLLEGALDDKEHRRQFLAIIQEHTDRINRLVDDLLSLSHLESHEIVLSFAPVPVRRQIDEIALGFKTQLRKHAIELVNEIPVSLAVHADKDRLGQVFTNLIDNAIKFNRAPGRITIRAQEADDMVTITIMDTGIGISAKDLPRIFERFYRVDKARSRELGGTGLGLSIVKHIVELHGGTVGVESVEGSGSTFRVTLPRGGAHA